MDTVEQIRKRLKELELEDVPAEFVPELWCVDDVKKSAKGGDD